MVSIKETDDIYRTIKGCFAQDPYFPMLYHYESPCTYEEAQEFTTRYIYKDVPEGSVFYKFSFVEPKKTKTKTKYVEVFVGYACIQGGELWDFYVNKRHRSDDTMDRIWEMVIEKLPDTFNIRLYEGNYRDINWLIETKKAKPVRFTGNKIGYYTATSVGVSGDKGQEHTYCRNLSQIILNFTKTQ